ncbi:WD40 repeat-like protein [Suillus hirtellus]|nr:WD40 repeat-like protein [Suillus hirtellus]
MRLSNLDQDTHNLSSKSCSTPSTSSRMAEAEKPAIRITTTTQIFKGHRDSIFGVAVFPDRRRMVTASYDQKLRLWDLENGAVLKIIQGNRSGIRELAVSRDGEWIASGNNGGEVIAWNKDGESLTQPIKAHSKAIGSLDFSPDSTFLASGSWDTTVELWNTKTWLVEGEPINCGSDVRCVRYSPFGEYLAIGTQSDIQIWNPRKRERIIEFLGHSGLGAWNTTLAWTLDGKQLVSAGSASDPTIRIWDSANWQQVGEPCKGHANFIHMIALNPTGTLLASASEDNQVRLWRLSDRRTIAIFKHSDEVYCVAFSKDGKYILSGGRDAIISKWAVPLVEDILKDQASDDAASWKDTLKEQVADNAEQSDCEILTINMTARNACVTGDLPTADRLLTQEINADTKDYNSYANRSFVKARNSDWDRALDDALKSISVQPSLMGCISKGIALCGKRQFEDAMKAFDIAFMYVDADLNKTRLLLLIKAIALFNANQHEEAILRVQELATTRPNPNSLACGIVEAYLHLQLGMNALDDARHNEAADHFAAAVNTIVFSSILAIHSRYDIFVVVG